MNQFAPLPLSMSFARRITAQVANWLPRTPLGWLTCMSIPLALSASFLAFSQAGTPPNYKPINLATEPLYAASTIDKPTMALALSVEFPTVGAQYLSGVLNATTDATYDSAKEYLGYYNAESCYNYNNSPTEAPGAGLTTSDYKRFDRIGTAASRQCANAFSGNFLNWASSSAIDMLRLALSGGDRYIDTQDLTILQRAVLPNDASDPICFWNMANFPGKRLSSAGGGINKYWGAVPDSMISAANGSDIMVSNGLNRIYFKVGNSNSGSCTDNSSYKLSTAVVGNSVESPSRNSTQNSPSGLTQCINGDTGICSFSGVKEVWYGAGSKWKVAYANNGLVCTNGCNEVLGDPNVSNKKVYIKNYTGSWLPTTADGSPVNDGAFFARVQVCNVGTDGALQDNRDYGLCFQYPNGKYKPTGVIQKYSDQMRLAAFGYLMDQTQSYNNGRYGSVLRAPMKYVGSKTYDTTGLDNTPALGNSAAEWNAVTGVFSANPDNDTSQTVRISGVINYLNKFGRTGPKPGRYKKYDPVGELHYEALRYLQGMPPSADAIKDLGSPTGDLYDGYPVYTDWVDPYGNRSETADYSCVKSNIVVIGDINTHDGGRLPTASAAKNVPDIAGWRNTVKAFESNSSANSSYVDGAGVTRSTRNSNPIQNTSALNGSQTSQIIGSAYWARTHDIRGAQWNDAPTSTGKKRPGLRVKTFLFDVSENGGSDVYATRSASNQFFMAAKYGGFETDPTNRGGNPYNTWGNPFIRQTGAAPTGTADNNVWAKAPGVNTDPQSYYLQSDARGVLNAFNEIFGRAASASRSIAGGAASSSSVSSGSALYTARFDTSNWTGDVVAESISVNATTKALTVGGTPLWSAANRLDTRASAATVRNIVAGKDSATANPAAQNFVWGSIDTTLQAHLSKTTPTAVADTLGQDRLNYIRGDKSKEGNPFRVRSSLLGDIINSSVVYSGVPAIGTTGAAYAAFRTANASRTPAVFAGANDGMLHAFNASTGDELFGYIPSWLAPNLPALTDPTFATTHKNYVDAPIAISEAQVAFTAANAATDWKTVLVSGTGGGGSGVFALDITDPTAFDATKVMWEFKRSDDADIGQVIGQPRIMKLRTSGTNATPTYRWFAVVASGVNNYVTDSAGRFSATGKPTLFLLALDKAVGTAWALGTNYYKISVPVDATLAANTVAGVAPGLVNFNALYGRAGEVTDIFMGDLHGKLWKLTFNPGGTWLAPSDWNMDKLSYFNKGTSASPAPYPMYIAKSSTGTNQPITAAPTLFSGPVIRGIETFYVSFGTGKYLETSDSTSAVVNSVYTIYDNGSASADTSPANASVISSRARLIAGTVNTSAKTISVPSFTWGRPATDAESTSRAGWYFDMPETGEKLVSHILDLGSLTGAFNTVIPGASGSTAGSCSTSPGSGNQYAMNIKTGASTYIASTVGIPGPAIFFVNDEETTETKNDSTGRRIRTTTKRGLTIGQGGVSPAAQTQPIQETIGRLSWRQIFDYQDMKNQ
jgi:type IV pilus assembly protein PilY1